MCLRIRIQSELDSASESKATVSLVVGKLYIAVFVHQPFRARVKLLEIQDHDLKVCLTLSKFYIFLFLSFYVL